MPGGIGTIAFIGGVLIVIALIFGVISNSRRSKADRRRTEEGTKNLYASIDREDQVSDPDPNKF